jgi:hypothetical protein
MPKRYSKYQSSSAPAANLGYIAELSSADLSFLFPGGARTMRVSLSAVVAASIATVFAIACSQGASPTRPSLSAPAGESLAIQQFGQPGQVLICHFEGHESSIVSQHDFVTGTQDPDHVPVCNSEGGSAIWVSRQACVEGHAAVNLLGTDCNAGHQ